MFKQQQPQYWMPPPPRPPFYRVCFDWLRSHAFTVTAAGVALTYLGALLFFSGRSDASPEDLAFLRTIAETQAETSSPRAMPAPTRTTALAARPSGGTASPVDADSLAAFLLKNHAPATPPSDSTLPAAPHTVANATAALPTTRPSTGANTNTQPASPSRQPTAASSSQKKQQRPTKTQKTTRSSEPPLPAARQPQAVAEEAVTGTLVLTSQPTGAEVLLDGESVGRTPFSSLVLPPGLYKVTFQSEGYETYTTRVHVNPRETSTLHGQLTLPMGTLDVRVEPEGSALYVDANLHRRALDKPYTTRLAVGPHRIKAVHPTLGTWENVVYISKDQSQQVVIIFNQPVADQSIDHEAQPSDQANTTKQDASSPELQAGTARLQVQPDDYGVYAIAEQPPVLIGGLEELHRNVHYPEKAYQAGLEGRVYVQFYVDEQGRVNKPTIAKGLGLGCNTEALRAVKQARFKPGRIGGKPVKTRHTLYIEFKIG